MAIAAVFLVLGVLLAAYTVMFLVIESALRR